MTRILLADVGNTRVKWAVSDGDRLSPQRAADHARWTADDWAREVLATGGRVDRVAAVTVAGEQPRAALVAAAARHDIDDVRFYASTAAGCGVTNAYPRPELLGADRWAAMVGARALFGARACCVVDVGTAATVDAITATGQHLGGFIVPGPRLMVASLLHGTSDLASHSARSDPNERALFADNTRDAIERGCRVTLAALVDRACHALARDAGDAPVLVLTGGAAGEVAPYVVTAIEHVPDLVLQGVFCLARSDT